MTQLGLNSTTDRRDSMNTPRLRTLAIRARRAWSELDYVQRRLFEIQTGIPITGSPRRRTDPSVRLYGRDY
jgi:hypothetical protein